jgi:hypothetical protein
MKEALVGGRARSALALVLAILAALSVGLCAPSALADVVGLAFNPNPVIGTDSSTGTVQLNAGGFGRPRTVTLTSSNPNVAAVPPSVMTDFRNNDVAHFTITTHAVPALAVVFITASEGDHALQANLNVLPPSLTSITFNPTSVRGGDNSVATITINRPAPAVNWFCSIEGPFPPIYFGTGSIVSFTAGATSTTKTINTTVYPAEVNTLITVRPPTGQSPNVSATLTVVPTRVQTLGLTPSSVTGGTASLACVTLNGAAETGGAAVQLSSSDPSVASVPPTLQIAQGDNDGCFLVQSHAVADCASTVISASFGGATLEATLNVGPTERITDNADNDRWNSRHSSTVGGKVLWHNDNDVYFDDGASTQLVQARGDLDLVSNEVFGLGGGGSADEVIGAWRRGEDFAWVWRSGHAPALVSATNPIDPKQAMNPEAIGIADGSVFMVWQAFFDANSVKHVFRVDPTTGLATNLTGDSAVPGVSRLTTDGGKAAWLFVDSPNPKLHFYDGSSIAVVDSGEINGFNLRLARGRLVYEKVDDGVSHIFLYDSTAENPSPVRISPDTDADHGHFAPATDGYHLAWLFGSANHTNSDVLLNGGLQLNDVTGRPVAPPGVDFPLQLQRGQLLWKDTQAKLRYAAAGAIEPLCLTPASSFSAPWLADGYIAGFGPVQDSAETDNEVFMYPGITPDDADLPMPPILILPTPGDGSVILQWDGILGASSYNVYLAEQPGVTKDNYGSLPGGRRIADIPLESTKVCELTNGITYHFVVTAVEAGDEGGNSFEVSATPTPQPAPDLADVTALIRCLAGPGEPLPPAGCTAVAFHRADLTCDADVDLADFALLSTLVEH